MPQLKHVLGMALVMLMVTLMVVAIVTVMS